MTDAFDDYQAPTLGDFLAQQEANRVEEKIRLTKTAKKFASAGGTIAVSEADARLFLEEEQVQWDPTRETAKDALLSYELTEKILAMRVAGKSTTTIAETLSVPASRVRTMLNKVATRFKERQWTLYSQLLATRIQRSEENVDRVMALMESPDPYVVLAAHAELRKDVEALPKIFGLTNTTVNNLTMNSVQLGSAGGELAALRRQMMGAVDASPEARQAFLTMLQPPSPVAELPPRSPQAISNVIDVPATEKEPNMPRR